MRARVASWWFNVRDTLWPIPAAMTLVAILVALLLIQIDERYLVTTNAHRWWLFEGGSAGARGVLSVIAGTSMTIATMAFSITIVALQLGSSQFSPRILRGFTGDRGNQVVLGVFVATFAYSLVVLRVVRTETDDASRFVPGSAVTVALLLSLVDVGALIYFFHHATRSIQANVIIDRATQDTIGLIEGECVRRSSMTVVADLVELPDDLGETVVASRPGYIQSIDLGSLVSQATAANGVIRVLHAEGEHLLKGAPLARMRGFDPPIVDEHGEKSTDVGPIDACRGAFIFGIERTLEHDVELGFRQISDIALKALSPGINDPTTAMIAIDRLEEALDLSFDLRPGTFGVHDSDGAIRVLIPFEGFPNYLSIAFDQIRHYGAGDVTVMLHLLEALERLAGRCQETCDRQALAAMALLVVDETRAQSLPEPDGARIAAAARWAMVIPV